MSKSRLPAVLIGAVATLALAAAVYTLQAGRGGEGANEEGQVTNLQTSNAGTAQSIGHALVGKQAPAVTLPDLSGRKVSLEQYRGKRVILAFWTSW